MSAPAGSAPAAPDLPSASALLAAAEATWPPAARRREGPWTLRDGQGGGKRVSAATAEGAVTPADLPAAEAAMRAMRQAPLVMVRPEQEELDRLLASQGYRLIDPVTIWCAPIGLLTDRPLPRVTVLTVWEPLQIMREIWAGAGIGAARQAVMDRVPPPRTGLLGRWNDMPAGAGFVAVHGGIGVVHALEILPHQRRQGVGGWMMRGAAFWTAAQGARHLAVLCTQENAAANALYAGLGMVHAGGYHYRMKQDEGA